MIFASCLKRPLPSSRIPPWDLLLVLRFLRGPPFEPLSACSLRDLTQKVLFLVSLATACRVGGLQAVSRDVSFSGSDILSYLLEFVRLRPIPFLAPFVFSCCRSLLTIFWKNFCSVLPVLFVFTSPVSLLSLLILIPFLCLLAPLLVLFRRML